MCIICTSATLVEVYALHILPHFSHYLDFCEAPTSELTVEAALDDTKKILFVWSFMGSNTSIEPTNSSFNGILKWYKIGPILYLAWLNLRFSPSS